MPICHKNSSKKKILEDILNLQLHLVSENTLVTYNSKYDTFTTLDGKELDIQQLVGKKTLQIVQKTTQKIQKKKGRKKWTNIHQKILTGAVKLFKNQPSIVQTLLQEFSQGFIHNKIVHLEWREFFKQGKDPKMKKQLYQNVQKSIIPSTDHSIKEQNISSGNLFYDKQEIKNKKNQLSSEIKKDDFDQVSALSQNCEDISIFHFDQENKNNKKQNIFQFESDILEDKSIISLGDAPLFQSQKKYTNISPIYSNDKCKLANFDFSPIKLKPNYKQFQMQPFAYFSEFDSNKKLFKNCYQQFQIK